MLHLLIALMLVITASIVTIPASEASVVELGEPPTSAWDFTYVNSPYGIHSEYWVQGDAILNTVAGSFANVIRNDVMLLNLTHSKNSVTVTGNGTLLAQYVESNVVYVKEYEYNNGLVLVSNFTASVTGGNSDFQCVKIGDDYIVTIAETWKLYTKITPATDPDVEETHEYGSVQASISVIYYDSSYYANGLFTCLSYGYNLVTETTDLHIDQFTVDDLELVWSSVALRDSGNYLGISFYNDFVYAECSDGAGSVKIVKINMTTGLTATESSYIEGAGNVRALNINAVAGVGAFATQSIIGQFNLTTCAVIWQRTLSEYMSYDRPYVDDEGTSFYAWDASGDWSYYNITGYSPSNTTITDIKGGVDCSMVMPLNIFASNDYVYIIGTTSDGNLMVEALDNIYEPAGEALEWLNNAPIIEVDFEASYSYDFNTSDEENSVYDMATDAGFLSINTSTGVVSGECEEAGEYYVNVTATVGEESIYHNYTLTVDELELAWVNHAPSATGTEGSAYSYTFTTNYVGEAYAVDTDAEWLTINSTTGVLSGTAEDGEFYVNVTATVGVQEVYHNYTLTVANVIIAWIAHAPSATGTENVAYTYTFTTSKVGETFALDSDAEWLSINSTTGVLSGTAEDGTFYVNVTSTYDDDTIYHNYTLTVANVIIAWIAHAPSATGTENVAYTYTMTTNMVDEVFAVTSTATWLHIGSANGTLYGVAEDGVFIVNITASYDGDTIYDNYTLTVANIIVAWTAYSPTATDLDNTTYSYTFATNKVGEVFAINTSASWLHIGSSNGTIYGISVTGTYYVNVTATFDGDTIYHNYTLTVSEPVPPAPPSPTNEVMNGVAVLMFLVIAIGCLILALYSVMGRVEKR